MCWSPAPRTSRAAAGRTAGRAAEPPPRGRGRGLPRSRGAPPTDAARRARTRWQARRTGRRGRCRRDQPWEFFTSAGYPTPASLRRTYDAGPWAMWPGVPGFGLGTSQYAVEGLPVMGVEVAVSRVGPEKLSPCPWEKPGCRGHDASDRGSPRAKPRPVTRRCARLRVPHLRSPGLAGCAADGARAPSCRRGRQGRRRPSGALP